MTNCKKSFASIFSLLSILFICTSSTYAQEREDIKDKPHLYYIVSPTLHIHENIPGYLDMLPGLRYSMGINRSTYLKLGLGIAMEQYMAFSHIPFFIDVRGDLSERKWTPHWYLNAGYGFAFNIDLNTSNLSIKEYAAGGIGIKRRTKRALEWIFAFDVRTLNRSFQYESRILWPTPFIQTYALSGRTVQLGCSVAIGF